MRGRDQVVVGERAAPALLLPSRESAHWRLWVILGSGALWLLLMEAARIWVAWSWSLEMKKMYLVTDDRAVRGRFAYHPVLGYVPRAGFRTAAGATQDSLGLQLERMLHAAMPAVQVEALNAGVPSWTSAETVASLPVRILPLEPGVLVVMDGRNDASPEARDRSRPR